MKTRSAQRGRHRGPPDPGPSVDAANGVIAGVCNQEISQAVQGDVGGMIQTSSGREASVAADPMVLRLLLTRRCDESPIRARDEHGFGLDLPSVGLAYDIEPVIAPADLETTVLVEVEGG